MSNYCAIKGEFCNNATEFGYCQTTACVKQVTISTSKNAIFEHTTMTNREWLNSLSDEKLARYFHPYCHLCRDEFCIADCQQCNLNWLQAEHEVKE